MDSAHLVGRGDELARLAELVTRQPLVTITGAPGVGKSAVARELGRRLVDDDRLATLWCDVGDLGRTHADRDPLSAMADHFGFGSVDSLQSALDDTRHLVLIDGCELSPIPVADVIDTLLDERPDLRIVATSRRPLGSRREYLWVLPPLEVPPATPGALAQVADNPAVRLYLERSASAGATLGASHLDVVAELVRELDGLPLGIELAAARARTLGPADLLDRIDQQLDLLRAGRGATSTSSLRVALDVAYAQLEPAEQALLRSLSVFRGSIAGDLVHAVCSADGDDQIVTSDLLGGLVDASLVQAEPGLAGTMRYRLLNVVRRYAADQLDAAGETDAAEERCVARLADLADSFVAAATTTWSDELVARMLGCFHTLVGAIELAMRRDRDGSRAMRLVVPLYAAVHGIHAHEVAALGASVLRTWPTGDELLRREAVAVIAAAHLFSGDAATGDELAASVLDDPRSSDLAQVIAARAAGFAAAYAGDAPRAVRTLDRGIELAHHIGGPFERELSIARLAVRAADPDHDDLVADIRALDVRCREAGEPVNQMWCLIVLGHVLVRAGRLDEARAVSGEAAELADRLEHPWGRGAASRIRAVVAALQHGWSSSVPLWTATIDVNIDAGDRGALGQTVEHAIRAAAAAQEPHVAVALATARLVGPTPSVLPPMLDPPDDEDGTTGTASMAESARRVRDVLRAAAHVPDEHQVATSHADRGPALRHKGDVWTMEYAGTTATVRHVKGIEDLARLLADPGIEIHCLDLMDAGVVEPDTGPDVDHTARARYEERIRDLQAELDEATRHHDTGREELVATELDVLVEHLARATALAGRDRSSNATVERARAAVRWRLRAAIERITEAHPTLGRHLATTIHTGAWCVYGPDEPVEWQVER